MAKAKASSATETSTDASAPITIKVQGQFFSFSPRYFEGHVLTSIEADVLNQTFGENLRNNFASRIRDAADKLAENLPDGESARDFSEEEKTVFASEFAAYAESYSFKTPRVGAGPVDPIDAETKKIAKAIILVHLGKKNIKASSLPEGNLEAMIKGLIAKQPQIRDEAVRRVEALKSAGDDALDGLM
jgi:hypothetical protein